MTFSDQISKLGGRPAAPYSFFRDPASGQCVLTERCADGGFQIRRNPAEGFDDSRVEYLSYWDAYAFLRDTRFGEDFPLQDQSRFQIHFTAEILRKQVYEHNTRTAVR